MRTLTEAEARTISVLLGSATAPERERLRRSQLPRSTYHAARRRAYEEGWLRDRYVPEPDRFGRPWAVVTVARPFADRVTELSDAWSAETGTVLQFGGTGAMGAVVLFGERKKAERFVERLQEKEIASTSLSVVADLRGPAIPVYFDFEGIWSHLSGTDGTIGYPRGLGGSGPTAESDRPPPTDHQIWAAGELAFRPFADPTRGPSAHLVGPLGLPYSQQRLVAQGWVNHRVFLDPAHLSAFRGNAADLYVFVTGTWKPDAQPEALFQSLVRDSLTFPFLFAVGGGRLLLGAMGTSNPKAATSLSGGNRRRPIMPTLQSAITGIEIVQEPASAMPLRIDHRYDRVVPRKNPS